MPIRLRVTVAFAGVMAILLAALGLFIYLRFETQLDDTINENLRLRVHEVRTILKRPDVPLGGSEPSERGTLGAREEGFIQILGPNGRVLDSAPKFRNRPLVDAGELRRALDGPVLIERRELAQIDGPARLLATPASRGEGGGRKLVVVAGSALEDRDEALENLETLLVIGAPVALLIASLAGYGMAAFALRPVETMRRRAAEISADAADERLPLSRSDDELSRLGRTLNEMLDRLETALERERAFVDDASHELRTPLALHKTELELALRHGRTTAELRAAVASSIEEVDRLIQLAEDLLVIARFDKGRLELDREGVPVAALFADVRERFRTRAAEAGRSIVLDATDGLGVRADRLRLQQALTNLVDNALRHGAGEVRLGARRTEAGIQLRVTDEGPGFPAGFPEQAFERFARADAARGRGGAGLGLSIVDAIARAHGGRAGAANRLEGGAEVWIELPREPLDDMLAPHEDGGERRRVPA